MEDRQVRDNPGFEFRVEMIEGAKYQEWVGKIEMRYTVTIIGPKTLWGTGRVPDMI